MADNDITITVDADNNTTAAFGAAARGARTVGEATQNANRALRETGERAEVAAVRMQRLAAQQREATDRARFLQASMNTLRRDIAQTGDASGDLTRELASLGRQEEQARLSSRLLASQHRSATEQANDLARAYRRAAANAEAANIAARRFGNNTVLDRNGNVIFDRNDRNRIMPGDGDGRSGIMGLLATLPGMGGFFARAAGGGAEAAGGATAGNPIVGAGLLAGGAGIAALLAPLLGGAVTGAVGAVGGIGGVGLGVAGAIANDPDEFRARWNKVIQDVTGRWIKASASWMEPVKGSIEEVDKALKRLPIEDILSNSAGYLDPLTKGATGFLNELGPGLSSLVKDVGPVIEMLGTRLPKLGADFGNFFAAIGKGSKGGASALDDVLYAVGRLTKGLGVFLASLADMYQMIKDGASAIGDFAGRSADWVAGLLDGVPVLDKISEKIKAFREDGKPVEMGAVRFRGNAAEESFKAVTQSADEAAKAVKAYVDSMQKLLDLAAGDKNAGLALSEGWIKLNEELRDGKRTLDLNTQAGIDNQKALLDQVQAAEAARQAQLALGVSVDSANSQFDANIERIRQMAYSLGYNKQQVDALIASLGVLDVTKAAPKVEVVGAKAAMEQGIALGALLNNIAHTYTAKVQVVVGPGISLGNALHHAIGGPTSPGLSTVNEWGGQGGGEVMSLPTGTMIYGGAKARGGDGAASMGGGSAPAQVMFSSDGSPLGDLALELVRSAVTAQGGRPELLGLKTGDR